MTNLHGRLFRLWEKLSASYWFVPAVMAVAAVALALGAIWIDQTLPDEWTTEVPWLYANQPAGARAVLSTIAGSMITVASVTFSITIAAVSYASGQFGPRILTNFMRDRGNQVTLGTFIATFLYCLLVLRTVREAPDGAAAFAAVPHIAAAGALLLAVASVGVLIYFIHHVPESIHISHVVADIGGELNHKIEKVFPLQEEGEDREEAGGASPEEELARRTGEATTEVLAPRSGYIQNLDERALMRLARKHDLVVEIVKGPGDFLVAGRRLFLVHGDDGEAVADEAAATVTTGHSRTPTKDVLFLVDELVEMTGRALSTGINDPFTAMTCMDWLGAAIGRAARRPFPSRFRYDDDGALRIVAAPASLTLLVERAFERMRPYVTRDRNAALHALGVLTELTSDLRSDEDRAGVRHVAAGIRSGAEERLTHPDDRRALGRAWTRFEQGLAGTLDRGAGGTVPI